MKRALLAVSLAVVCSGSALAALPTSLEQFQDQVRQQATDPQAAVSLWFDAVHVYLSGDQATGLAMIRDLTLPGNWDNPTSAFMFAVDDKPHILRSYAVGTTPDDAYQMDPQNYQLEFSGAPDTKPFEDQPEGLYVKLFVVSTGADAPRPITLKKGDDGVYRLWEFSSVYVDCRPPTPPLDESIAESKDPQWVMKRFFEGLFTYTGGDPAGGEAIMNSVSTRKALGNSPVFAEYLRDRPWMFGGFVVGTSPETNYEFDKANWELNYAEPIREVGPGEETRAVLSHSGADFAKPVYLVCDERGEYRIRDYGNVYSNCRLPGKKELDTSLADSKDPQWVMHRFFEGVFTYIGGNPDEGRQIIESVSLYKDFADQRIFVDYLKTRPWMFGGFVKGTTPEGDYKFDAANWELDYARLPQAVAPGKETTASLRHSGADFPKPVYLACDERGEYRIRSYANVYTSCRLPGKRELDASLADSQDPAWVMRRFFEGIFTYIDGNQDEGAQIIDSVSARKEFANRRIFIEYLRDRPWMFGGFVKGTSPEEDYKFDRATWELSYAEPIVLVDPGKLTRASLKHSGADVAKPIYLLRDDRGEYRIRDYSNVYSSCRLPGKKVLDASLPESQDPQWVMRRFFEGIITYIDGDPAMGEEIINSVSLRKDFRNYRVFVEYLKTRPWMFGGFMQGTSPDNAYAFDHARWELNYSAAIVPVDPGKETRATFKHSGSDVPKPIYLVRDSRGEYRIRDYSNVYSNVRLPAEPEKLTASVTESTDPVWVVRQFIQGALMVGAGNKDAGLAQMSSVAVAPVDPRRVPGSALGADKTHIWRSYVKGTSPDTGYQVADIGAIEIDTYYQPGEDPKPDSNTLRIFVRSSGADSARPMRMAADSRGQWRISEYSSLCSGVRPPK